MIALACDHGALDLKHAIMRHLEQRGLAYKDFGCYTKDSCDYPDFAGPAAQARRPAANVTAASSAARPASACPSRPTRSKASAVRCSTIPCPQD